MGDGTRSAPPHCLYCNMLDSGEAGCACYVKDVTLMRHDVLAM